MHCHKCKRYMHRASGQVRSVFIDGFEVSVRVRKASPGEGRLCDDCCDALAMRAIEQAALGCVERDIKPSMSRL